LSHAKEVCEGQAAFGWQSAYVKVAFFRGAALKPMPPVVSRQKDVRYFHIYEDTNLDDNLMTDWIRQASELPVCEP
jgi:hypothetical protein